MREITYSVAMSLDGFIAGPGGEYDWIPSDDLGIDFEAFVARFDTLLMGRKTYELTVEQGPEAQIPGMRRVVFSASLSVEDHPEIELVPPHETANTVRRLKGEPGKQIWLFGGGQLFANLLEEGLVDFVEVAVMPILLGDGIPLLPASFEPRRLEKVSSEDYRCGVTLTNYRVVGSTR